MAILTLGAHTLEVGRAPLIPLGVGGQNMPQGVVGGDQTVCVGGREEACLAPCGEACTSMRDRINILGLYNSVNSRQ